jgi:hypothetical protein
MGVVKEIRVGLRLRLEEGGDPPDIGGDFLQELQPFAQDRRIERAESIQVAAGLREALNRPSPTGSSTNRKTIGIARVWCCSGNTAGGVLARITSGDRPTSSAAYVLKRVGLFAAKGSRAGHSYPRSNRDGPTPAKTPPPMAEPLGRFREREQRADAMNALGLPRTCGARPTDNASAENGDKRPHFDHRRLRLRRLAARGRTGDSHCRAALRCIGCNIACGARRGPLARVGRFSAGPSRLWGGARSGG